MPGRRRISDLDMDASGRLYKQSSYRQLRTHVAMYPLHLSFDPSAYLPRGKRGALPFKAGPAGTFIFRRFALPSPNHEPSHRNPQL